MSFCVSEHIKQLGCHWIDFHEVDISKFSRKISVEDSIFITNLIKITVICVNTCLYWWQYIAQSLLKWDIFQKMVEKIKTYFVFNRFFPKILPFMR